MEEDEEDKALLSSLGITSANPEDIERDILEEVLFSNSVDYFSFLHVSLHREIFSCLTCLN